MFTGIIEETGVVRKLALSGNSGRILISASRVLAGTNIGDSICVNGVCLTVTALRPDGFEADIMPETVRRSGFRDCRAGDRVNLERALALGGRLGGHIVSGHIDGVGQITHMAREENAVWLTVSADEALLRGIVAKGSIAIDGISLTVASVSDRAFRVSIIPHTGEETTLLSRKPGDTVNLETDVIGKYVQRLMTFPAADAAAPPAEESEPAGALTLELLQTLGY